jgi:hypothetical protein
MIDELLAHRSRLDRLAASAQTPGPFRHRVSSELPSLVAGALAAGGAQAVAAVLSGQGALLVPLHSVQAAEVEEDGGQAWREAARALDSGVVALTAEGPSGLRVTVEKQDSEAERARLAVARTLQLADQAVSNSEALALAEAALLQVIRKCRGECKNRG